MHFKTAIPSQHYWELAGYEYNQGNGARVYNGRMERANVRYALYQNGTVDIQTSCSYFPFKLQTDADRFKLIGFFSQLQTGLENIVNDPHQRIVKDVSEWYLTECDINKDIKVSSWLQIFPIKIQVKHLDHLFSIYIKLLGKDTVCRIEEKRHFPMIFLLYQIIPNVKQPLAIYLIVIEIP
jgi:hypothetical protein